MLASKSVMFAKSMCSKPATLQFAAQRFMSAAPDMKVNPTTGKPVIVLYVCNEQKNYKIFSVFRFDNERDNKFHYEKYAVDLNEYISFRWFEVQLWNYGSGCSVQDQERARSHVCFPKVIAHLIRKLLDHAVRVFVVLVP